MGHRLQCLLCKAFYTRYQVSFYLWRLEPILTFCEVSNYYGYWGKKSMPSISLNSWYDESFMFHLYQLISEVGKSCDYQLGRVTLSENGIRSVNYKLVR